MGVRPALRIALAAALAVLPGCAPSGFGKDCIVNFFAGDASVNGRSGVLGKKLLPGDTFGTLLGKLDLGIKNIAYVRAMEDTEGGFAGLGPDGPGFILTRGKLLVRNETGKITVSLGRDRFPAVEAESGALVSVERTAEIVRVYVYSGRAAYLAPDKVEVAAGERLFVRGAMYSREKYKIPWDRAEFDLINSYTVDKGQCKPYINGCAPDSPAPLRIAGVSVLPLDALGPVKAKLGEKKQAVDRAGDELADRADRSWTEFKKSLKKGKEKLKDSIKSGIDRL